MTLVWLLLGLLVLWLAVIVVRALQFKPYPMEKTEAENFPVDEKRALERFQDMIRLKTVSYPDEKLEDPQAFADFQKLLAEAYPAVTKTCPREILGRRGMLYHWKGKSSAKPSVLMAHYDVVPVNENEWQEPPFGAVVKDGELWGRGTLDTKGTLHGVMEAAEMLIGQGFVPENDVYFAFGGDEEIFGGDAPAIVEELKKRGIHPEFVLDEGGAIVDGVFPGVSKSAALIGTAEKGTVSVRQGRSCQRSGQPSGAGHSGPGAEPHSGSRHALYPDPSRPGDVRYSGSGIQLWLQAAVRQPVVLRAAAGSGVPQVWRRAERAGAHHLCPDHGSGLQSL